MPSDECLPHQHSNRSHTRMIVAGGGAKSGEDTINNKHLMAVTRRGLGTGADAENVYVCIARPRTRRQNTDGTMAWSDGRVFSLLWQQHLEKKNATGWHSSSPRSNRQLRLKLLIIDDSFTVCDRLLLCVSCASALWSGSQPCRLAWSSSLLPLPPCSL